MGGTATPAEVVVVGNAGVDLPNRARRLLPLAREAGLAVACDLQDVDDPADPYRRDFVGAADVVFFSAANHEPERVRGSDVKRGEAPGARPEGADLPIPPRPPPESR